MHRDTTMQSSRGASSLQRSPRLPPAAGSTPAPRQPEPASASARLRPVPAARLGPSRDSGTVVGSLPTESLITQEAVRRPTRSASPVAVILRPAGGRETDRVRLPRSPVSSCPGTQLLGNGRRAADTETLVRGPAGCPDGFPLRGEVFPRPLEDGNRHLDVPQALQVSKRLED